MRFNENTDKIVFTFGKMHRDGKLFLNEKKYIDFFNDCEPYDRKAHVFYIPHSDTENGFSVRLSSRNYFFPVIRYRNLVEVSEPDYISNEEITDECNNQLSFNSFLEEKKNDGLTFRHSLYNNRNDAPVHVFVLKAEIGKCSLYVGTPNDGYASKYKRATIPDMIQSAVAGGKDVLASINGDFFDIFGDMHPSGLVVKNGRIVANENSKRPFIGITKDGKAVISDRAEKPELIVKLECACSGLQRIVRNGKLNDTAPIESFGFTPHPRSAAGITENGDVVLMVVDGRIPDYSNGASLYDLGKLMINEGCTEAINLDGGGSSAVYLKENGSFTLKSVPADLYKPNDKLIRKEANCIMVIRK